MVLIFVKSVVYVGKIFFLLFDEGWDSQTDVTWKELLMSDNRGREGWDSVQFAEERQSLQITLLSLRGLLQNNSLRNQSRKNLINLLNFAQRIVNHRKCGLVIK